jgi:hypothetical protein
MQEPELYLDFDQDRNEWQVWFPHPLGGREVLGTFDTEAEAREFYNEQYDSALDYLANEENGEEE